jgi:hypothetical protein
MFKVHSRRPCAVHTVLDYFRPRSRCCSLQSPPVCDTHCRKFLSPPAALRQGTRGRILDLVVDDVHSRRPCAVHTVLDYFRPRSQCCSLQSLPVCDSHCRKFLSPPAALRQGARGRILNLVVDDVQSSKFKVHSRRPCAVHTVFNYFRPQAMQKLLFADIVFIQHITFDNGAYIYNNGI